MPEREPPLLDDIHQRLRQANAPLYIVAPTAFGKSNLLDDYSERFAPDYDGRFWFGREATTHGGQLVGLFLARLHGHDVARSLRRGRVESLIRHVLLIFDHVEGTTAEELRFHEIDPARRRISTLAAARSSSKIKGVPASRIVRLERPYHRSSKRGVRHDDRRYATLTETELRSQPFANLRELVGGESAATVHEQQLAARFTNAGFAVDAVVADDVHVLVGADLSMAAALPYVVVPRINPTYHTQIAAFEALLNDSSAREASFQRFFEEHSHFLAGYDYVRVVPQVVLHRDDGTSLRPDFMLQPYGSVFSDLLELKLPTESFVVGSRDRKQFAAGIFSAVAQVREYRDYFEDSVRRNDVLRRYGLSAYRPQATIVAGRRPTEVPEEKILQIRDDLPSYVRVVTYDDLLGRMKNMARLLSG